VNRSYPTLRADEGSVRLPFRLGHSQPVRPACLTKWPVVQNRVLRAARILFPSLLTLSLTMVAHAQGTMDFSGAQTLMGTFKTTLMKALLDHVPLHERLIVIEQPAELKITHPNAVRWEAVEAIPGQVAVTPSQLVAAALRHRPDRIIIGEIRDECGYDLLQAMNTGHGGTLSTIHAKSAWDALNRLSDLALSARPNLNHSFIRSETAEAIDFALYCERDHVGRRRVRELIAVKGYSHADQSFETEEIYRASPVATAA
jgi:pilus assembly protein CpaF